MRRALIRFNLPILICLLCCSLACSELSELMTLRDNVSNDYCFRAYSGPRELAISVVRSSGPVKTAEIVKHREITISTLPPDAGPHTANDLLHRLSIQRT